MNEYQQQLCSASTWDFSDVRALFVNGTLKPSPGVSNTEGLARIAIEIMEANSVTVDTIRAVDHDIAAARTPTCETTARRPTSGPSCSNG
jgi:hypothetical protein